MKWTYPSPLFISFLLSIWFFTALTAWGGELPGVAGDTPIASLTGYGELVHFMATGNRTKNRGETVRLNKIEAHLKLDLTLGTETLFLKSIVHGYLYPDAPGLSDPWYENDIEATECYLAVVQPQFDIKAGKQIIKWGTADAVNPTSYFNPYDFSEILLRDDDLRFHGVYALAARWLPGDVTLEAVVVPVHTPTTLPGLDAPWELTFAPAGPIPVLIEPATDELSTGAGNTAYALRLTGTQYGADFSLSGYHGPDREVILMPEARLEPSPHIAMVPLYEIISTVGADLAFSFSNITLQAEATYTPDKPAPTKPSLTQYPISHLETEGYLFWTAGATLITDDDTTLILEYVDAFYTKHEERYLTPLFAHIFSGTVNKRLFDDDLTLELAWLFDTSQHDSLFIPSAEWNFQNGLILKLSAGIFSGSDDTLFGSYSTRDVINISARYYF